MKKSTSETPVWRIDDANFIYIFFYYSTLEILAVAVVYLLEVEVLEWEVDLYDAGGLDPGPEDVLLRGLVVLRS